MLYVWGEDRGTFCLAFSIRCGTSRHHSTIIHSLPLTYACLFTGYQCTHSSSICRTHPCLTNWSANHKLVNVNATSYIPCFVPETLHIYTPCTIKQFLLTSLCIIKTSFTFLLPCGVVGLPPLNVMLYDMLLQASDVTSVEEALCRLAAKEPLHGFTCSKTQTEVRQEHMTLLCVIMWFYGYDYVILWLWSYDYGYNHVILWLWSCDPIVMIMWSYGFDHVILHAIPQ